MYQGSEHSGIYHVLRRSVGRRASILATNVSIWAIPGFSCRNLVAIVLIYVENGAAYLPFDSEDPCPLRELEELVRYCESENLYLIVGCDSNSHHNA